jgi:hypothetical protein
MKTYSALAILLLLTIATPAFAAPHENNNNGKANNHNKEEKKAEVQEVNEVTIDPSAVPSTTVSTTPSTAVTPSTTCDPNGTWKNHGQYVSCVAKEGRGGKEVSEAAKSDVGKKHKNIPTPSVLPNPSASPSPAISAEPSTTPPITSALQIATLGNPLDNFMKFVQNIANFLNPFKTV